MKNNKNKKFKDFGPYSYWNWQSQLDGELPISAVEIELYSDAFFKGTVVEHGPYLVVNADPIPLGENRQFMRGRLIFRCEYYLDPNQDPTVHPSTYPLKTDVSRYHGGTLRDEMASLYSLALGVRLKAGGVVREFEEGNEYGKPRIPRPDETPIFLPPRDDRYILPFHPTERDLELMQDYVNLYGLLEPQQASTLIQSARLYQDAVWIAESDPEISWLLLVSAIEVAADHWYNQENPDIQKQLQDLKPELFQALSGLENDHIEAIAIVSKALQGTIGVTKKFKQFLSRFKPKEPLSNRPKSWQIEWNEAVLARVFKVVYDHRSKALHGGTPFPKPMCRPPIRDHQNGMFVERPAIGLAEVYLGASWKEEDVPIHLHVFEYIVRHSLLGWWKNMAVTNAERSNS